MTQLDTILAFLDEHWYYRSSLESVANARDDQERLDCAKHLVYFASYAPYKVALTNIAKYGSTCIDV